MTTREERARQRALKRKQKKLVTFFAVFIVLIIVVLAAMGLILNRVTPDALSTTENTTSGMQTGADDCYNSFIASSMVLKDYVFETANLEATVKRELGDAYNTTLTIFLSVSDGVNPALVVNASGASLEAAWTAVEEKTGEAVREELYNTVYLKADIVNQVERINASDLNGRITADAGIYGEFFRKGIAFDGAFSAALLEAEINANELIDYDVSKDLVLDKVNLYLAAKNVNTLNALPENLYLFTCRGYIKDVDGCYTLEYNQNTSYGRRSFSAVDYSLITGTASNVSTYLFDGMGDDGRFTYGYYPVLGLPIDLYDIGYHAMALSALSQYSDELDSAGLHQSQLENAAAYLASQVVSQDANTAYAVNADTAEITAGANIQAILAFLDYEETTDDEQYRQTAQQLGNGLIAMIDASTGKLNHVLYYGSDSAADYAVKTVQSDRAYDSSAVYALSRLYGETQNEAYLTAARTLTDALIRENYTQYGDFWVSLAMQELTQYDQSTEYYNLALRNFNENIDALESRVISMPQYTRLLVSTYHIYTAMRAANITTDLYTAFDYNRLVTATVARANDLLNGIAYPEIAMYFQNPADCLHAFFVRQDGFRIRLDDCASLIQAYLAYADVYTAVSTDAFNLAAQSTTTTAPAA